MKKIFFLIFALFVCTLAKAQTITDDFESYAAFTVNPAGTWTYYDGDGGTTYNYNAVTASNIPYVGSCIVMNPSQTNPDVTGTQSAHGGSQYLAIFNAIPSTITSGSTTNDWVISPQINASSGGTITFWARELTDQYNSVSSDGGEKMRICYSSTNNNPSSFSLIQEVVVSSTEWQQYSYTIPNGAKYVAINCVSNDVFALFIDDITITYVNNDPTIIANPADITFPGVHLPGSSTATVNVTGYNLTSPITASVTAPFEVSADGSNYSTSLSITSTGGTLYLRYSPTAQGTHNSSLTLFSGTTVTSVALTGSAVDCIAPRSVPYTCDFTNGSLELDCWEIVDANNDGVPFLFTSNMAIYLYNTDQTTAADDWLISPPISLGSNSSVSFYYKVGHWDGTNNYEIIPERYGVYVIPEGATYTTAMEVLAPRDYSDTVWTTQNIDLTTYNNHTVRIAIHITSPADMYRLNVDHFVVNGIQQPSTLVSDVSDIGYGRIRVGTTKDETVVLTSTYMNEPINVTTTAPFCVSLDGLNFFTNLTIPANPATFVDDTLIVRFAPVEAGDYSETVTATTTEHTVNITLKGSSFTCDTISTFTFTEDFSANSISLGCWDATDDNNDGSTFDFASDRAQYVGNANNVADDWLLSPSFALTGNQLLTFDFRTPSAQDTGKFTIAAITPDTILPLTTLMEATDTLFTTQTIDIRNLNGVFRIGFHCVSNAGAASLEIDNFIIQDMEAPYITATPSTMTFYYEIGSLADVIPTQRATVTGWALEEDIAVTVTGPFGISRTGTDFGAADTISVTGLETTSDLWVLYQPTAEGTHSGLVILTSGNVSDTIILNGTATTGSISVNPEEMTFTATVGQVTEAQTAQVIGINLTEDIMIGTSAPFEISTDDENYSSSVSITVTGSEVTATLYVRYNPTSEGTHSGTVNMASGTTAATITLNGTAETEVPDTTIGISENTAHAIVIYPNPASTILNVEAEGYDNLQIVNVVGQVVYSAALVGRTQVNVSGLSNGVYFVRLTNAEGTTTQKFVKR